MVKTVMKLKPIGFKKGSIYERSHFHPLKAQELK